jgi:hypothetical protein
MVSCLVLTNGWCLVLSLNAPLQADCRQRKIDQESTLRIEITRLQKEHRTLVTKAKQLARVWEKLQKTR